MSAAAEAGEIQSCKIAKTRKLENCKSRMNYQAAFAKAGENLSLHDWRKSWKVKSLTLSHILEKAIHFNNAKIGDSIKAIKLPTKKYRVNDCKA